MPMVEVSNGGTLPDELVISAFSSGSGAIARCIIPKALTQNYSYLELSGSIYGGGQILLQNSAHAQLASVTVGVNNKTELASLTKYDECSYLVFTPGSGTGQLGNMTLSTT